MKSLERRGFMVFHVIVAATGLVYLYMQHFMATDDPFAIVNHPSQPAILAVHGDDAFGILAPGGHGAGRHSALVLDPRGGRVRLRGRVRVALRRRMAAGTRPADAAAGKGWVERTVFLMGTTARFVAEAPDRGTGLETLERMVRAVEDAESAISTWKKDTSDLGRLNRQVAGADMRLPGRTCAMLIRAESWWRETGGAFDPAIGALVDVWGLRGSGREAGRAEIEEARRRSGLGLLEMTSLLSNSCSGGGRLLRAAGRNGTWSAATMLGSGTSWIRARACRWSGAER